MNKQYYLGWQSSLCPPLLDLALLAGTLACPTQTQVAHHVQPMEPLPHSTQKVVTMVNVTHS